MLLAVYQQSQFYFLFYQINSRSIWTCIFETSDSMLRSRYSFRVVSDKKSSYFYFGLLSVMDRAPLIHGFIVASSPQLICNTLPRYFSYVVIPSHSVSRQLHCISHSALESFSHPFQRMIIRISAYETDPNSFWDQEKWHDTRHYEISVVNNLNAQTGPINSFSAVFVFLRDIPSVASTRRTACTIPITVTITLLDSVVKLTTILSTGPVVRSSKNEKNNLKIITDIQHVGNRGIWTIHSSRISRKR